MLPQLIIIQITTFVGLIFLLRFLFSRNLNAALTRLNALHEENLVKESQLNEELKRAKEEKEAEIKRGKDEARALVEKAKDESLKLRLKAEEDAKSTAEKIISQGKKELEKYREKTDREIEEEALILAVEMVKQTFTDENKKDLQCQFINEIIEEIGKLSKERFPIEVDNVKVISSYSLLDGQRDTLREVLTMKFGCSPNLEETVDTELISGLILEMNGFVIDGTLKNRLRRVMPYIKKS